MIAREDRLGLYIHWPYCARICPYCDFNVYKAANGTPEALVDAMLADLANWRERIGKRALASIHFGGGTPSLMAPAAVAAILERADALFGIEAGAEIGLEANPNEVDRFEGLAEAGIERVSLGVQALDDASLRALGRDHDAARGLAAFEKARALFNRVSLDLIYARESQKPDDWEQELNQALGLQPDHLSAYQLTIEPGTAFQKRLDRGDLVPPVEDAAADMFEITQSLTEAAGLPAYEVSNHARSEAHQSVHNRLYWEGADWIGIGPGAHSRVGAARAGGRLAAEARRKPADYIAGASSGAAQTLETLSPRDEAVERALMGLRLVEEGISPARIEALTGVGVNRDSAEGLCAQGLLNEGVGGRLNLTRRGRIFADRIAEMIAPA
jgi:putative oxygen-independent coproporphyrinogen III oxidase